MKGSGGILAAVGAALAAGIHIVPKLIEHPGPLIKPVTKPAIVETAAKSAEKEASKLEVVAKNATDESIKQNNLSTKNIAKGTESVAVGDRPRSDNNIYEDILRKTSSMDRFSNDRLTVRMGLSLNDKTISDGTDSGIDILGAIPKNEDEFLLVFGENNKYKFSSIEMERVRNRMKLEELPGRSNFDELPGTIHELSRKLSNSNRKVTVLVGHNESGSIVVPPPPHPVGRINIKDLSVSCRDLGKICVVLSCNSEEHVGKSAAGIGIDLTYDEAIRIVESIGQLQIVAEGMKTTYSDFIDSIPALIAGKENEIRRNIIINQIVIPGTVGGGVVMIVFGTRKS